jgi:transposase
MKLSRIGVDLAKNVFQVHGVNAREEVEARKKLSRHQMLPWFQSLPPCLIGMEACAGAHYWARELMKLGHTVKLMAPQLVKPYIKGQKNDANDAEGICEAVGRPNMRFVALKSVEQQDQQATHRIRSLRVEERTATANQIRGLLAEYGIVLPQRLDILRKHLPLLLEDLENRLTPHLRTLLESLREDLGRLDKHIAKLDDCIELFARQNEDARRLQSIPGIGPITATALVASIGDASAFKHSRDLPAFLGLTPKQHSSGGKERLSGISKQGDSYLRTLLIHGARAALRVAARKDDPRSRWVVRVSERRHKNVAAVALANKNARIVWALLTRGGYYDSQYGMVLKTEQAG